MSWQKHIIKKQVIELQIANGINSTEVQNRVSQVFRDHIVQQLDKCFGQISPPGTIDKIDRLELNLGTIPIGQLEIALLKQIEAELQRNISIIPQDAVPATAGKNENGKRKSGYDVDLVTYYLQTGVLPWWATENTRGAFQKSLDASLANEPAELGKELQDLVHNEAVLTRLIYSCDDKTLYQLIDCFIPGVSAALKNRKAEVAGLHQGAVGSDRFRQLWWVSVFQTVGNESILSGEKFTQAVVARFARQAPEFQPLSPRDSDSTAINNIEPPGSTPAVYPGELERALKNVQLYLATLIETADAQDGSRQQLENIAAQLMELQKMLAASLADLGAHAEQQQDLTALKHASRKLRDFLVSVIKEKAVSQRTQLERMLSEVIALAGSPNTIAPSKLARETSSRLSHNKTQSGQPKRRHDPFSETEKIYVQNAGLVLLWPFLGRFFQKIGLAYDKAFIDESAAARACLMLQHLTGAPMEELFEAQLPLNKVMCGIDLEQPVNTRWFIQPDEAEAAENFLVAVIQNGPLWRTLSLNGFRQSYLNREGALSTRDGNWLLQVKRETYDVIVDRLPWTVQVVKLPWMKRLIFVEW